MCAYTRETEKITSFLCGIFDTVDYATGTSGATDEGISPVCYAIPSLSSLFRGYKDLHNYAGKLNGKRPRMTTRLRIYIYIYIDLSISPCSRYDLGVSIA